MKTPLDELARVSGSDIYVRPIPGFGSYQSGSTASGRIAIRGGHVDLDLTRLSQAQALRLETLARCHGDADGMSATPDRDDGYRGRHFGHTFAQYLRRVAGVGLPAIVKRLQRAVGVKANGDWGPVTEKALQKVRAAKGPLDVVIAIQRALDTVPDGSWARVTETSYQAMRVKCRRPR